MANTNYLGQIVDTILSIPGMNQIVKVDLRISRKNVLLLSKVIERGLLQRDGHNGILDTIPNDILQELREVPVELLKKADLTDMNEKLKLFQSEE